MNPISSFDPQGLLDNLGDGDISNSIYDLAFVLRAAGDDAISGYKIADALMRERRKDGSWGGSQFYLHDRVINTLSAVVALVEIGVEESKLSDSLSFLRRAIPQLLNEEIETIGFELTFLNLLEDAHILMLDLPYSASSVDHYRILRDQKLALIQAFKFNRPSTLCHSLEAINLSTKEIYRSIISENGSIGNSPAATAAYVRKFGHTTNTYQYLEAFEKNPSIVPSIYPFEVFEKAWVLYNYYLAGVLQEVNVQRHAEYLWNHWCKYNAATISDSFPIIDSDDTAVVYIVLKVLGYPVSCAVFDQFEEDRWFRCFELERNPSISANVHILEATKYFDASRTRIDQIRSKIVALLNKTQRSDGAWLDKWHISPMYCTSHAIIALQNIDEILRQRAVDYILRTQNPDGGWGICGSTHEETLYALQALNTLPKDGVVAKSLSAAVVFLQRTQMSFEPLWVDKGLYCPIAVVQSLKACLCKIDA